MSEIKLNAEALEEAGAALGFAVAALIRGFQAGMDAYDGNRRLPEVLVRSMRAAGGMREDPRGLHAGRGAPFPVRRLRKRNALQALRGTAMRRVRAGRRAEQWINKKRTVLYGRTGRFFPVRGCRIRLFNTLDSIARKRLFVKGRRLDVCKG